MGELDGSSLFYRLVRLVGSPFRYRVVGMQNVRNHGPALFVANHLGSAGPLASITSMPLRLSPGGRALPGSAGPIPCNPFLTSGHYSGMIEALCFPFCDGNRAERR